MARHNGAAGGEGRNAHLRRRTVLLKRPFFISLPQTSQLVRVFHDRGNSWCPSEEKLPLLPALWEEKGVWVGVVGAANQGPRQARNGVQQRNGVPQVGRA